MNYSILACEVLQISSHIHASIPSPFLDFNVHFVHQFPLPGMALFVEMDVRNCCAWDEPNNGVQETGSEHSLTV